MKAVIRLWRMMLSMLWFQKYNAFVFCNVMYVHFMKTGNRVEREKIGCCWRLHDFNRTVGHVRSVGLTQFSQYHILVEGVIRGT